VSDILSCRSLEYFHIATHTTEYSRCATYRNVDILSNSDSYRRCKLSNTWTVYV